MITYIWNLSFFKKYVNMSVRKDLRVFAGSSNSEFTEKICQYLNITEGQVDLKTFSDGEIWVKYKENVRGRDVYVIQSTMPPA